MMNKITTYAIWAVSGLYSLWLVYMMWSQWPHSSGWFAAAVWFGLYIFISWRYQETLTWYADFTRDILKRWRETSDFMGKALKAEEKRHEEVEEALVQKIEQLEGVLKQHDRNRQGIK